MKKSTPGLRKSTESDRMGLPGLPVGAWILETLEILVIVDDFTVRATTNPVHDPRSYARTYPTRAAARRVARSLGAFPQAAPFLAA